jgi:predicted phosphate transport protein (TIGR00153 family)
MKIFDKIPFMVESREEKTLMKIKEHLETTCHVVRELDSVFEALEIGDYELLKEKQKSVASLETNADKLRRDIEEDLYSGAFLPISRSRILDFVEKADEIADTAEDASNLLTFLERRESLDSVKLLAESIDSIEDLEKIREIVKKIRAKEHESDETGRKAYKYLYKKERSAKSLQLLSKLIEFINDISNKAEDASDSLSLIVLMHKA